MRVVVWFFAMSVSSIPAAPFPLVAALACDFGAVEVHWRVSDSSFSGAVAEVQFASCALMRRFCQRGAGAFGYSMLRVRVVSGLGWVVSVPCAAPASALCLGPASRGSRLRVVR
jgi:hypothetical protein